MAWTGPETFRQMPEEPHRGRLLTLTPSLARYTIALSPLMICAFRYRRQSSAWVDFPVPLGAENRMLRSLGRRI